ncbi:MAG: TM0996/MTH895 family glutaredoxin-like protein [Planctomycetes bacterium]|nr:TM0996/MTH895 family glutaredoxin-like protein [Planctomycetota bacterium]
MRIQILGTGCPKCEKLAEAAKAAADDLGIAYDLEKVTDITKIMAMGVMMTPALVVDGQVKAAGKVPDADAIKAMLQP